MKSSGISYFHFLWKIYGTISNRRTAKSYSNTPSENENDDNNYHTQSNNESLQGETSVEPNTNPIDYTKQNPLQIPESSYSEIFIGQRPNPSVEMQQYFSEVFSSERTETEKERSRLQH